MHDGGIDMAHRMSNEDQDRQGRAPMRLGLMTASALTMTLAWSPLALAQSTAPASGSGAVLEELVVTAQKRSERVQDVPISLTAISEEALQKRGLAGMGDYLMAQPSVVIQDRGPARNQVVIRGVATSAQFENPTVAFYFGEAPVTNGLGFGANGFPDLKTFDVGRVEVLRGPQGTLYGAGSMGGAIKVMPNEPSFNRFSVTAEASASSTEHGGMGDEIAAAVNAPINDHWAARLAAYHYQDAGYITNLYAGAPDPAAKVAALGASWTALGVSAFGLPARKDQDANERTVDGVRGYLTYAPSDRFKVTFGALSQTSQADGLPENLPSLGEYAQSRMIQEKLEDRFQLYTATASYRFEGADLTSVTSYITRDQSQDRDVSAFFLTSPLSLKDANHNDSFTQELRLSSPDGGTFSWLVGAFYAHVKSQATQDLTWHGTAPSLKEFTTLLTALKALKGPAVLGDTLFQRNDHNKAEQISAFGEASYEVLPKLRATVGVRVARYDKDTRAYSAGAFNGGVTTYDSSDGETVTTPKFQLEYRPDHDQLYYARAAKGFRLGAPNQPVPSTCASDLASIGLSQAPSAVKSDGLWSYELGGKRTLADGRATLNGAVFYIDWSNIQTNFLLPTCGFSFSGNAGDARSQGVELEFNWRATEALTLNASASYTDAKLTQDSPKGSGVGGKAGDRLPGIPQWTAQAGGQYAFNLRGHDGFARLDVRYISDYLNRFPGAAKKAAPAGDFTVVDARLGLDLKDKLRAELFGANLFDTKQLIIVDTELPDSRQVIGRPRTIGLSLRYEY